MWGGGQTMWGCPRAPVTEGPPGEGGEALLEVEGDEEEGALAAVNDQVGEVLCHVARASLRPKPQHGRAE